MREYVRAAIVLLGLPVQAAAQQETMAIDVAACEPDTRVIYGGLGSTTMQFVGDSRHGCVMMIGTEIENPRWNGFLDRICVVPKDLGWLEFAMIAPAGPDLSVLDPYCAATPAAIEAILERDHVDPATVIDTDADGLANAADNCPSRGNPVQADRDGDGVGDACDDCPDAAAPGFTNGCRE